MSSAWSRRFRRARGVEHVAAPKGAKVSTDLGSRGGAVGRDARAGAEAALDAGTHAKGAGLPHTDAPKHGPPTQVHTINAENVSTEATTTRRRRLDLDPAVKPLAVGAAGVATLAALGYAAQKVGDAWNHADDEQLPYTLQLPGGGLLYTDPITGETYVIVAKDGGGTHGDPGGESTAPNGYDIQTVTEGDRANAEAAKDAAAGLFNPWVLLAAIAAVVVIAILVAKSRGGKK